MPSPHLIHHTVTAVNGFHYYGTLGVTIIINREKIILGHLFPGCQMQKHTIQLRKYIYALLRGILVFLGAVPSRG